MTCIGIWNFVSFWTYINTSLAALRLLYLCLIYYLFFIFFIKPINYTSNLIDKVCIEYNLRIIILFHFYSILVICNNILQLQVILFPSHFQITYYRHSKITWFYFFAFRCTYNIQIAHCWKKIRLNIYIVIVKSKFVIDLIKLECIFLFISAVVKWGFYVYIQNSFFFLLWQNTR